MNKRYTIQIITPEGNLLGSIKSSQYMTEKILSSMDDVYKSDIITLHTHTSGDDERENNILNALKRTREKVQQMLHDLNWFRKEEEKN